MSTEHTCHFCGRVYDCPIAPQGCFSDDCPGHDFKRLCDALEAVVVAEYGYIAKTIEPAHITAARNLLDELA